VHGGQLDHGRAADQALHVLRRAAEADRHVADLARPAPGSPQQLPAQVDREAEALAEPDEREAVSVGADAPAALGDGGQVHVVFHHDRGAQALAQLGDEAAPAEAEDVDVADDPGRRIVGAGHAQVHMRHHGTVEPGAFGEPVDQPTDGRQRVRVGQIDPVLRTRVNGAGQIDQRTGDLGPAQIGRLPDGHRRGIGRSGVGGVDFGIGSRPAPGVPDDQRQAGVGQPPQHVGGGGFGQSGEFPQVTAGERAPVEQVLQGSALVHGAQELRRAGQPTRGRTRLVAQHPLLLRSRRAEPSRTALVILVDDLFRPSWAI
jgi:hypothetical protein